MLDRHSAQARDFLESSNVLEEVARDMDTLGYVGEYDNKLLGYLIAISRKLNKPLSGIVVSSSGAGKSKLVETLELLTPPEDVIFTSRLTPQSLYYMQKDFLRHKLLIVEERTGSELADYAIRSLQSKGKLCLATTVKNQTVFFEVKGPVSILETTASYNLNTENISRCFILHLDESKEQTERIHKYQRFIRTGEGMKLRSDAHKIIEFHHNVQRMLKEALIIIPYAEKLSFPITGISARRSNQKFLTLIEAVTLLCQYRRKCTTKHGLPFIESTYKDYEIAYDIFKKSYKDTLFITDNRSGTLLMEISSMDKDVFTRRDIARYTGWPDYKVRDNVGRLEESGALEIIKKSKGKETYYRLDSNIDLTEPEELEE